MVTVDTGRGLPQAAPRTALFSLKLCTGTSLSLAALAESSGQFEDKIIVKMPWGNISLDIIPKFVLPGSKEILGGLTAPMPGKVVDIRVKLGDKVKKGDPIVILEAMKMEHQVNAPETGKVKKIYIKKNL